MREPCTCNECIAHASTDERIRNDLHALGEQPVDALALRRLKARVLDSVAHPARPPRARRAFVFAAWAAAAVPLAAILLYVVVFRRQPPPEPKNTTVDTVDEGGARFTRRSDADLERVELTEGTLRLKVRQVPGGKRVIVKVPDGEIEDRGTIFVVVVESGRTQKIEVEEGQVFVRLDDARLALQAGATWTRPRPVPSSVASPRSFPPVPPAPPRASAPAAPSATVPASTAPALPDADDEDAAYLEVVRLARGGRTDDARAAAREYLRRFPNGFRRDEMKRLAR